MGSWLLLNRVFVRRFTVFREFLSPARWIGASPIRPPENSAFEGIPMVTLNDKDLR